MKKSICLFLLMLAATFQVAFAQDATQKTPCDQTKTMTTICNHVYPKECPTCEIGYCMYYNQYGELTSVELTDFYSVDFETKKPCTCLTKEQMVQLCFKDFFEWAEKVYHRKAYENIATTYLQPCWHVDYKVMKVKKETRGLDPKVVQEAQNLEGMGIGGSSKPTKTVINEDYEEIILDYHSPCDGPQICCYAIQNVKYIKNPDGTVQVVLTTMEPPTSIPECNKGEFFPIDACYSMCSALIFESSSKRTNTSESHINQELYPNPNDGNFKLIIDPKDAYSKLEIFDNLGNIVHTMNLNSEISEYDINASELPPGIYHYRLVSEGKPDTQGEITIIK